MTKLKVFLVKFFHRKRLIRWGVCFSLLSILYLCRAPILCGIGFWLINEDKLEKAQAIVILGGNSFERAPMVKKIFKKNTGATIYCTGNYVSPQFKSLGLNITEAQNSERYLMKLGVPDSCIKVINYGTSTMEEAAILKRIATKNNYKKLIIVTSMFHTGRVHKYFNRIFSGSKTKLIVRGAYPLNYSINKWWHSEEGLLFVNNEYVKSFYYWWNY
jgi:uncharacterized SAM-binding protein YcdF (DUF218 family)